MDFEFIFKLTNVPKLWFKILSNIQQKVSNKILAIKFSIMEFADPNHCKHINAHMHAFYVSEGYKLDYIL